MYFNNQVCRSLLWHKGHTGWWKGFVVLSTFINADLKNKIYFNFKILLKLILIIVVAQLNSLF